jgi:hypothetical protein
MSDLRYLDAARLAALDAAYFRHRRPFPWINPEGLLTEQGFATLYETLPELDLFEKHFGVARKHGQQSHDRYALEYRPDLPVDAPWHEFIAELNGPVYTAFLKRMLGVRSVSLSCHWHYTPNGCSVSPHCDAKRKLGSHIFYFNTEKDWDPSWGGETLILDSDHPPPPDSAPRLEDFERVTAAVAIGNRSLLFARTDHSWHAVREIRCPPQALRRVFILVIEPGGGLSWWRRLRRQGGY